jgi:hypothetical protein
MVGQSGLWVGDGGAILDAGQGQEALMCSDYLGLNHACAGFQVDGQTILVTGLHVVVGSCYLGVN